jgi:uncharacterized membrane protein (Fun14 family)
MVIPILGADMETPLFSFGGSSLLGFLAGYSLKRIIKIAAIIIGAFILGLAYLSYKGWINVQWQIVEDQTKQMAYNASAQVLHMINDTATKFATSIAHSSLAAAQAMPISASIGFMTGMFLGLKH